MSEQTLGIIHSVESWLPTTMTWLYTQVKCLPSDINSQIICKNTQNIDRFPVANIHALTEGHTLSSWISRHSWRYARWYRRRLFQQHVREGSAQILHSHFGDTGWQDMHDAKAAGLKHVVTFYGYDVNYLPTTFPEWHEHYRELFAHVDLVLCEGPHFGQCIAELGCPVSKIKVQHLGVRLDEIPFHPRVWYDHEPLRILISGSFTEKKGIPYALEAVATLAREVPLTVTIIGDANHLPKNRLEKTRILDIIAKHGLQDQVRLLGYQPYTVLFEEAYKHHIFLSPSITAEDGDTEGGAPVSIIEMAASGMAIVSTTHCDIPEVVRDGVTGWLAPERDVSGLVEHLRWLVGHPAAWSDRLLAARQHVETHYDAKTQGERLAEIYRAL